MTRSPETVLWIVEARGRERATDEKALGAALREAFSVRRASLWELRFCGALLTGAFARYSHVITSVEPRTLLAVSSKVGPLLQGKTLWVYDPKPWEAMEEGLHEALCQSFVRYDDCFCAFVVPSDRWACAISMRGMAALPCQVEGGSRCVVTFREERALRALKLSTHRGYPYRKEHPEGLAETLRRSGY